MGGTLINFTEFHEARTENVDYLIFWPITIEQGISHQILQLELFEPEGTISKAGCERGSS